ncbi:MAG: hypothetical protein KGJ87_11340 [Planctomycetota bacterium]|nr:hypothetical protein [Planctomycetota bacterium]
MKKINRLIINSPYEEPRQYWEYIRNTREFVLQGKETFLIQLIGIIEQFIYSDKGRIKKSIVQS